MPFPAADIGEVIDKQVDPPAADRSIRTELERRHQEPPEQLAYGFFSRHEAMIATPPARIEC